MNTAAKPCPICGKPAHAKHLPFCSSRCAMVDLGKWLGEGYRIESEELPEDPSDEASEKR